MRVFIREANRYTELSLYSRQGDEFAERFIRNAGGFKSDFIRSVEKDAYLCSEKHFDWWAKVIAETQATENRIKRLIEIHGQEAVEGFLEEQMIFGDLEDHARILNHALDRRFGR